MYWLGSVSIKASHQGKLSDFSAASPSDISPNDRKLLTMNVGHNSNYIATYLLSISNVSLMYQWRSVKIWHIFSLFRSLDTI